MRLATCIYNNQEQLAVMQADSVLLPATTPDWPTELGSMLQVIDNYNQSLHDLGQLLEQAAPEQWIAATEIELLSPIPRPRQNIMCLGWNYIEHVEETVGKTLEAPKLPKYPIIFTKAASSMNGPYSDIPVNLNVSDKMDWEVELAVIIGKGGKGISRERALEHVFGYTVINEKHLPYKKKNIQQAIKLVITKSILEK